MTTRENRIEGGEMRWVRVGDITIDLEANRGKINRRHVENIKATYKPKAMGHPMLSERRNGELIPLDGMHRVTALQEMGMEDMEILCEVDTALTKRDEASQFVNLNNRISVQSVREFVKRLEAGEPEFVAMDKVLRSVGLKVATGGSAGTLQSVGAIEELYHKDQGKTLSIVVHLATGAWGTDERDGKGAMVLRALGLVVARYGDQLDLDDLVSKLSAERPIKLMAQGEGNRDSYRVSKLVGLAIAIVGAYNRGRRTGRLADWTTT